MAGHSGLITARNWHRAGRARGGGRPAKLADMLAKPTRSEENQTTQINGMSHHHHTVTHTIC
eukprot:4478695-Pyramimonas_sp.AAC.1